jgi:hypothetical protein
MNSDAPAFTRPELKRERPWCTVTSAAGCCGGAGATAVDGDAHAEQDVHSQDSDEELLQGLDDLGVLESLRDVLTDRLDTEEPEELDGLLVQLAELLLLHLSPQ